MTIHKLADVDESRRDDWRDEALCAQTDPDAFFPDQGGSVREAKRICSGCPVRAECLEWAIANDERFGVYGGLSERERRPLLRVSHATRDANNTALRADGEKRCRTCQKIRQVDEFSRHSSRHDGLRDYCKSCDVKARQNRRSQCGALQAPAAA